jgi:hypothetical protein
VNNIIEDIQRILRLTWAPIGKRVPKDEYDSYVPVIHFILCSNILSKDIHLTSYLYGAEAYSMGGDGSIEEVSDISGQFDTYKPNKRIQSTVVKLLALNKKYGS